MAHKKTATKKTTRVRPKRSGTSKKPARKRARGGLPKTRTSAGRARSGARPPAARKRKAAKKQVARKPARKKLTRKAAKKKTVRKAAKKKPTRKPAKKKTARKPSKRNATRTAAKKKVARKAAKKKVSKKTTKKRTSSSRSVAARGAGPQATDKTPRAARRPRSPYTKIQLRPLRQALLTLRTRIMGDLNLLEDEALRAVDPDISAEDVAAHGTDAFERTITLNLMENDARRIQHIDAALARMQAGSYGLCGVCHGPIPLPRLEALPFAQSCVRCQEQQERKH